MHIWPKLSDKSETELASCPTMNYPQQTTNPIHQNYKEYKEDLSQLCNQLNSNWWRRPHQNGPNVYIVTVKLLTEAQSGGSKGLVGRIKDVEI